MLCFKYENICLIFFMLEILECKTNFIFYARILEVDVISAVK